MWSKLSIRWQLIALLSAILILIEIGTFSIDFLSDIKQRRSMAVEQAQTLSNALQHDLVLSLINPQADTFSNISFRVSSFKSVNMITVSNKEGIESYQYLQDGFTPPKNLKTPTSFKPIFTDQFLFIKQPLLVDDFAFGEIFFLIDLTSYKTGLKEQLINRLLFFPFELFVGLLLAIWISNNYTRPFYELANAMKKANVREAKFPKIETQSKNEIGDLYLGYNQMTTEITRATNDLTYLGEHDTLTGLLNRYAIDQKITYSLKDEANNSNILLLLDIDQFKLVNDAAGHIAGDELLKQLGQVITSTLPTQADIARVGGDDFLILITGANEDEGIKHAEHLLQVLSDLRFTWKGEVFSITACIGLINFKPREHTLQSLIIALDTAFYSAKSKGNSQFSVYHDDDKNVTQYSSDVQTVAIIKDALQEGRARFELFAQAIVPLQKETDKFSYEILLRLRNAEGDMVFPDNFLPTAERYQLMVAVDSYVLWKFLETVIAHPNHIEKLSFVNVNMGGATLNNPDFQNKLHEAIDTFDFPWEKLVLEITETSAVGNLAQASDFIHYCRGLGIRVALDDFGTGMASFEYLKHLPFDVVKIDGSFVRDMLEDPVDLAMVRYVNDISKLRGQETIAEFVEVKEHLDTLKEIGIDYGQGYFLEKPKPLSDWI